MQKEATDPSDSARSATTGAWRERARLWWYGVVMKVMVMREHVKIFFRKVRRHVLAAI
jgi:hypothetical protein